MIIDCNASLGHWPFRKLQHSDAEGFLRLMDGFGVTQAWVGAFEGVFYRDLGQANRDLLAEIAAHRDRLIPWAVINPHFPGWQDDLAEAREAGVAGVRLYPNYHGYTLEASCLRDLLAALQEEGVPVAIYERVVDERLHHWRCPTPPVEMDLSHLVRHFPELKFLHFGGTLQAAAAALAVIRSGQVFMDISRIEGIGGVGLLVEQVGSHKVLFGSHAPYFYLEAALLKITEAGLAEEDREAILHGNAEQIVGS